MSADGKRLAVLMGAKNISADAQLIIGVYPRNGDVAEKTNDFDEPGVEAFFSDFK